MKLLDLSKFEKVSEDKHTTRMRHKDGHEMTILHSKLPKIHMEQLKRLKMAKGGKAHYDDGTPNDPVSQDDVDTSAPSAESAPPVQFPAADALSTQPVQQAQLPTNLGNINNAADVPAQSVAMTGQAADLGQRIDAAASQGKLAIAQQQERNAQDILDRQNQSIADMKQHTDDFADYSRNNPQDSNKYWNSMDDAQKSQTALGLFLGGLGGGGTSNLAMDYLNKQIDRNVSDQQQNYQKQKNIFGAYQSLYGDENVSTALTKVSMNDKILADSDRLTAQLGNPIAQKQNMILKANTLKENADLLQKAAMIRNAPASGGGQSLAPAQGQQQSGQSSNPEAPAGNKTPAYGPESANSSNGTYQIQPLLKPGAAQIMDQYARRATGDPAAAAQLGQLKEQYQAAAKADGVLGQAHDIFNELRNNATPGGWTGRMANETNLGGIPVIGGVASAISHGAGDFLTGARKALGQNEGDEFAQNRDYNTAAQKLSDLFSSVYKGIGVENLKNKLSGMLPDEQDTPENVTKKEKAFEDLIKSSLERNVLQNAGMSH
jgi:hypothetical protein